MIELVNPNDPKAIRNKNNILALYEIMINTKRPQEAANTLMVPEYKQHNTITPDGAAGLAKFWTKLVNERPFARAIVHKIMAVDDYVFAHVNFLNLFDDDPSDTGISGVDMFLMNEEGKALEHWDCLQLVGTPENAAPWLAPNLPAANPNGMF